tara:strand:+ start:12763 stop:13560 length:798 start_codon:yes stop_codon:yes gene_type:complete
MKVALLISTYKSPMVLDIILESVIGQTKYLDEIIIAEDDDSKNTYECFLKWKRKFKNKIFHYQQKDLGFRKSLILNKALFSSKSDYIIQIDGDCIPDSNFIHDHISNAKKGFYLFGTRVHIKKKYVIDVIKNRSINFSFFSKKINKRFRTIRAPFLSFLFTERNKISSKFRGCNTSFWKKDFIDINGYDNNFKGWGREDSDLMIRMHNYGIKGKRLKFAGVVYHLDHDEKDKSNFYKNDLMQKQTIKLNKIKASNGLSQLIDKIE